MNEHPPNIEVECPHCGKKLITGLGANPARHTYGKPFSLKPVAVERAIAESQASQWISVEEKLPEDGVSALIFVPEWEDMYLRYRVAWINYDENPPVWVWDGAELKGVTHWMPLPVPPKGNENV